MKQIIVFLIFLLHLAIKACGQLSANPNPNSGGHLGKRAERYKYFQPAIQQLVVGGTESFDSAKRAFVCGRKPSDGPRYFVDACNIPDTIIITDNGGLGGQLFDADASPTANGFVYIVQQMDTIAVAKSDTFGHFHLRNLEAGNYLMSIRCNGRIGCVFGLFVIHGTHPTILGFTISNNFAYSQRRITDNKRKRFSDRFVSKYVLSDMEIAVKPTTHTSDLLNFNPGIYQNRVAAFINCDGARSSGNLYVVDGIVALTCD